MALEIPFHDSLTVTYALGQLRYEIQVSKSK